MKSATTVIIIVKKVHCVGFKGDLLANGNGR